MEFSIEEKCSFFDKLEKMYYCQNFGSTSKSDFELFLFSEYVEHCLNTGDSIDDYSLSKIMGISQSRIRTLKERKELKYPHKGFNWKFEFAESVRNAKYDDQDHYVKIIIQDVNVMNEIRHYIEEKGWYDECSLNRKLLKIPLGCFVDVCVEDIDVRDLFSEQTKKRVQMIAKSDNEINRFLNDFSKDGLKSFLMSASKETLLTVLPLIPFGGVAKTAFQFIESIIKEM